MDWHLGKGGSENWNKHSSHFSSGYVNPDKLRCLLFLDNMADRKLTGSSQGKWVECEIVADIPTNVEALTFGFLVVGG